MEEGRVMILRQGERVPIEEVLELSSALIVCYLSIYNLERE